MEPYIKNIDLSKPLGKIVHKFCEKEFYRGFKIGCVTGIGIGVIGFSIIVYCVVKRKN